MKKLHLIVLLLLVALPVVSATCPQGSHFALGNLDSYGDDISDYYHVTDSDSSLGINDSEFSIIEFDDGYVVIDMNELVFDRSGDDLYFWGDSTGAWAAIYVSNSPNSGFEFAENRYLKDVRGVDFGETSYDSIRYVKIVNIDYTDDLYVDAVAGKCVSDGQEVPEFGTIALIVAAIGAISIFAYVRRN